MKLLEILKELSKDIYCSMEWDVERQQMRIDLKTMAKSDLFLYEDGFIRGRYDYESRIDFDANMEDIIIALCYEFKEALHGRGYGQAEWFELCKKNLIPW